MEKIKGIVLGLLPIAIVLYFGVNLYTVYPGTPTFIFVLLLSFTAVLISVGIYRRFTVVKTKLRHEANPNLPEIERGLIYVTIDDFVEKFESKQGFLYIGGEKENKEKIKLVNVLFDKLTDQLYFTFTNGIKFSVTDIATIGVGDYQLILFKFDQLVLLKNKKERFFKMEGTNISEVVNEENIHFELPKLYPSVVFAWED